MVSEDSAQSLLHMTDYFEIDEHPLLEGLMTNWSNPTESLVERIWGKPDPKLAQTINQIGDEVIRRKAERLRMRHEPREPELLEGKDDQDLKAIRGKEDTKKLDNKDDRKNPSD